MENNIIADTSVLIGLQRADKKIVDIFSKITGNIQISRITALELLYGSRDKQEKDVNKKFINELDVLEIDPEISFLSYKLIDKYGLKNKLGVADSLIAATAIAKDIPLWTENIKHFKQIKEVSIYIQKN